MTPRAYAIPVLAGLVLHGACGGSASGSTVDTDVDTDTDADTLPTVSIVGVWDALTYTLTDAGSTYTFDLPYTFTDDGLTYAWTIALDVRADMTTVLTYTDTFEDGVTPDRVYSYPGRWSHSGGRTYVITNGDYGDLTCRVYDEDDDKMRCSASDVSGSVEVDFER